MPAGSNYDDALEQLQAAGLDVRTLETGRLARCKSDGDRGNQKNGWYSLHELTTSQGDTLIVGAYGNWRDGSDPQTGKPLSRKIELKKPELTSTEREAIRTRIAEEKKRSEYQRKARATRAASRAEHAYRQYSADGDCEYLKRKGIKAYDGVRFTPSGKMVIPVQDVNGKIHGLQLIYSDPEIKKKKGRDKDFWPTGLTKQGNFFLIGLPGRVVLIAEGYATAASLHEATGLPVVVAWDAGNILPVVQKIKKRYPKTKILICADDDYLGRCRACSKNTPVAEETCQHCGEPHGKSNTGVNMASAAALAVGGAWLAPQFTDRGTRKLTDFNDLAVHQSPYDVGAQVEAYIDSLKWRPSTAELTAKTGEMGSVDDFTYTIDTLLTEYSIIYGTETVFDRRRSRIVSLSSLRAVAGKSLVRMWLEHPARSVVLPEQVGFDPTCESDIKCNLWDGFPVLQKTDGSNELQLELYEYLCSNEDNPREIFQWIMKWLAYPIQNPGAKMQTSLLIHGAEGTGKNTVMGVVRKMYGKYGGIFDQTQLESQFNGCFSGKLFMIGNEVVTRMELYHQQGRLKNMITETEWQINEKNLPTRLEANHCNFVFFSNRLDIAKLDKEDRRYCVVWTPPALSPQVYKDVAEEINNGGVEAMYDYLLNLDLGDFNEHSKPPLTRSKRELIELSMDSTERFWRDWTEGHLPISCTAVLSQDLYDAYRLWISKEGVFRAAPQNVLIAQFKKKRGVTHGRPMYMAGSSRKQGVVIWPPGVETPPDKSQATWLGSQIDCFRQELEGWKSE